MLVTKDKLREITLGVIRIEEENGYFLLRRFTSNQEKIISERIGTSRMFCTASVKLEFYTKGGEISFRFRTIPGTQREYYSIDLLTDGIYRYNLAEEKLTEDGLFSYVVPFSDEYKRITIYLPTTARMDIRDINLPDDILPHRRDKKMLILGDSLNHGYYPDHFQNTYANIISDEFDLNAINQAIGGDCYNYTNLEKLDFNPEFILVSCGLNDWASGKFGNGENADLYYKTLREMWPDTIVYIIIPPRVIKLEKGGKNDDLLYESDSSEKKLTRDGVRNVLCELSKKHRLTAIRAEDFIPQYKECFYKDEVHMTDLGNTIFAYKIIKAINNSSAAEK